MNLHNCKIINLLSTPLWLELYAHPFEMGPHHYYGIIYIYIYILVFTSGTSDRWLLKEVGISPDERGEATAGYRRTNSGK